MTSGGTESILCAVKAARASGAATSEASPRPRWCCPPARTPPSTRPPTTSASRCTRCPCATTGAPTSTRWRPVVNDNTVLVVGSAPQYPQGVIDPIPELAALAASVDANFHTDACMGGFVLPFMEQLGEDVPPWDFRVEGVTTISADLHKLGLRTQGRVGAPPPHEGAAPLPDLRVRRLARRLLRLARHAGHTGGVSRWRPRGPSCTTSASRATCASPARRSTPASAWSTACGRSPV